MKWPLIWRSTYEEECESFRRACKALTELRREDADKIDELEATIANYQSWVKNLQDLMQQMTATKVAMAHSIIKEPSKN